MSTAVEIFFSYAWGDAKEAGPSREKIINEIYEALVADHYQVVRDKYDLGYTGQISKFMHRIGEGHLIIVGISDKYLKSPYCMYELLEIFRNAKGKEDDFLQRIIPLRVEENLNLKSAQGKQVYIKHWKDLILEEEESVKNNPDSVGPKRIEWLKRYREIKNELDDLLELFSDINTLTTELLSQNNFQAIKTTILKRISEEEFKLSLQEKKEALGAASTEVQFNVDELFEISAMDKEAVVISVKDGHSVFFRSPEDFGKRFKYPISTEKFSQQVTGILQRLLLEDNLRDTEFEILGTSLFQRLLNSEEARATFITCVERAVKNKLALKIILRFDEASSQLACLPWEYLYCPLGDNKGLFVGESNELILTRRLSVNGEHQLIQTPALHVLLAVSEHLKSDTPLANDEHDLLKAIQDIPGYSNKHVSGQLAYFSSLNQLADFLIKQQTPFQAVHVFGMARMQESADQGKQFELAFGDAFSIESQTISWKNGSDFIACFPEKPSLIFLHATGSQAEETYLALSGFAFNLLKEVPGVLALQAPAGNNNGIQFAKYFYKALIQDEADIEAAVKSSLGEISFFKSKQPRVKVSAYSVKSIKFVFDQLKTETASQSIISVKCKHINDYAIRKGERCNNEIELIKQGDGEQAKYTLQESEMKICKRCGNDITCCHSCGYLISSPEDNFCVACRKPVLRKDRMQQEGVFDQRGSSEIQKATIKDTN